MRQNWNTTLYVDFEHITYYDAELATAIAEEHVRYELPLRQAVMEFVKSVNPIYYNTTVTMNMTENAPKTFWNSIYNVEGTQRLRELRTAYIGQLIEVSATVTRTSEVRPELMTGVFTCTDCQTEVEGVDQQFKYTEPMICPNPSCGNRTKWMLQMEKSTFVDFQKVRVQENANEIPAGSMPRSLDVILRHEQVELCKAGDKCVFTGMLVVLPDVAHKSTPGEKAEGMSAGSTAYKSDGVSGLRALGCRDLNYKLSYLASNSRSADSPFDPMRARDDGPEKTDAVYDQFTAEEREEIEQMRNNPQLYDKMVSSVAPTIFGHDEIKRGILLMLFGGVHKETKSKTQLRGDLNVCIVGDPATAKSQFLKWVCSFMPRAVYASGRASSAAGLTASVVRDSETGEFCIEAGALMLADNGVCCIDEFEKMEEKDQVAIHEAMEQQTISISKAGIQATLNARASVLAAANPVYGRYDTSKALKSNVNISAPIMSRFDLFFICVDECNDVNDMNIAKQITRLHMNGSSAINPAFTLDQLKRYIKYARTFRPEIKKGSETERTLVENYRKLRENDAAAAGRSSYRITVRQLESMIRLSEALAKLHCEKEIKPQFVQEAFRLLRMSIIHVDSEDIAFEYSGDGMDAEAPAKGRAGGDRGGSGDEKDGDDGDDGDGGGGGNGGTEPGGSASGADGASASADAGAAAAGGEGAEGESSAAAATAKAGAAKKPAKKKVKKVTITLDKYDKIKRLYILRLQQDVGGRGQGMKQRDLVAWYLNSEEQKGNISGEEELATERRLANLVVRNLVNKDRVLLALDDAEGTSTAERTLIVHPNFDAYL